MEMNQIRRGTGKPLLLIHGLGGTWRSWRPILNDLAAERYVIAVDLPGFGKTPPLAEEVSIPTLADAVTEFFSSHSLTGTDVVGSSMGARLVLELARRGVVGATVALDPGGFWQRLGAHVFLFFHQLFYPADQIASTGDASSYRESHRAHFALNSTVCASLEPVPSGHAGRNAQLCGLALLRRAVLSVSLRSGPAGRRARLNARAHCDWMGPQRPRLLPKAGQVRVGSLPMARLHWFENCGHFPHWDVPLEAARMILANTGQSDLLPSRSSEGAGTMEQVSVLQSF